jgi:hypothetical protein
MFKNWKTLVSGVVLAVSTWFAHTGTGVGQTIGIVLSSISGLLLGATAQDANNGKSN